MARDTYCQFSSVALFRVNALVGLPWTTESCSGLPQPVTFTLAISSAQKNTQQESNSQLTFSEFICHLKSLQITCRWNGCQVTTKYIIHALRILTLSHQPSHVYSKQVFNKYQPMYDNYTENLYPDNSQANHPYSSLGSLQNMKRCTQFQQPTKPGLHRPIA